MLKKLFSALLLVVTFLAFTAIAGANELAANINEPAKSIFGERNVAIITAAPKSFTKHDLDAVTPYIRAKIRFPEYSIQTNEIVPYGSITIKDNVELDALAKSNNAELLLFINMPTYEEQFTVWFGRTVWHVQVDANIYLYDTQTKIMQLKKLRSREYGEYGSILAPAEVLIRALTQALEKLPTTAK